MLAASYAGCDRTFVILFFMCMMFFKGLAYATLRANPVDLSPNYAGILMGIQNGTGALAGLLSPVFVPLLITGVRKAFLRTFMYHFWEAASNVASQALIE